MIGLALIVLADTQSPGDVSRFVGDQLIYIATVIGVLWAIWRKAIRPIVVAANAVLAATQDITELKGRVHSIERRFERILDLVDVIATDEAQDIRAAVRRALTKP